jgi:hypothetical protein
MTALSHIWPNCVELEANEESHFCPLHLHGGGLRKLLAMLLDPVLRFDLEASHVRPRYDHILIGSQFQLSRATPRCFVPIPEK